MKKLIILIILSFTYSAMSQSLSVFDVDASNFPTIKANFYAFDKDGKQLTNLSPSDFELKENGLPRTVTNVSCPTPKPPIALSSVLVFDVSGSMIDGPPRIQSAKNAANAWIYGLPLGQSECALVSFNENSNIVQDFTTSRDKLKVAVEKLNPSGGTNYHQALIDLPAGGLQIAKTGKFKKVIVFLTDGLPNFEPNTAGIIKFAKDNQITIYAVTLDMPAPQSIKDMTIQTGGQYFENITTLKEAEDTYRKLLQSAQGGDPCEIEWQSEVTCVAGITGLEIKLIANQTTTKTSFQNQNTILAKLEFNPTIIKFENPVVGVKSEKKVIVTARNANFKITNIKSNIAAFEISPKSFTLNLGESKELTVSYLPTNDGYQFGRFEIENDLCPSMYYASGGFPSKKPKIKTIKLLHPNGGEVFVAGSDTLITWEGVPESDTVQLQYSIDNGTSWQTITEKETGLQYKWKNIPKPQSAKCKVRINQISSRSYLDQTGFLITTLSGHKISVLDICWSPDGSRVITASKDKTAIIWDAETGNIIHILNGHNDEVKIVRWSHDGKRIVTGSKDKTAIIWDAETGNKLHILSYHEDEINNVKWSPDGSRIVTLDKSGDFTIIWDAENGNWLRALNNHSSSVLDIDWSPDGTKLATSSRDNTTIIWDMETGKTLHTLGGDINSWSPDGTKLATSSSNVSARIWDVNTGDLLLILNKTSSDVYEISWSPDGNRLATLSIYDKINIWDVTSGIILQELEQSSFVSNVVWSPDGLQIAARSTESLTAITIYSAKIWNVESGKLLNKLIGHFNSVTKVSWSPDGTRIATSSLDSEAKIWYAQEGITELQNDETDNVFSIVAPSPSAIDIDMGQCLVSFSKDSVINGFISNKGTYKVRIDSIYFRGTDANAFSLVSGFPQYIIESNQEHYAEVRFVPNRIGIHSAEIVIITQADTLIQNIRGVGVQPYLNIENDLIDFGAVEIQNFKDTIQVATIKNIGNAPLTITKTVHGYPNDKDFTTIKGGGSFTLQPNEIHKMDLRFAASSIGRTSGTLEFHYNGVGSPAVVQLYGQGLGGNVIIPDDSAYAGERIKLKLLLGNQIKPKSNDIITNYKVKLSYNPTLLYCDVPNSLRSFGTKLETVEFVGNWDGKSNLLGEFDFIVGLGNADTTIVTLDEFHWLDKNNNIIDFDVEKQNGTFTLLGICEEGGKRLVNPLSKAGIVSISPNPAENQINLVLSLSEFGSTEVCLYNILGEKVSTIYSENVTQKEILPVNSDLSKIASGQYILIFRTPTYTETRQLLILR